MADVTTNAGRCDICGETIDMKDGGDTLVLTEYTIPENSDSDVTDQECADAVADALERVGESGADYDLAKTIREQCAIRVHESCLYKKTNYGQLETEPPA